MPHLQPTSFRAGRTVEVLFEFRREADYVWFRCELWDHEEGGVEVRIFRNRSLSIARHFDTRALAIYWAASQREVIETDA